MKKFFLSISDNIKSNKVTIKLFLSTFLFTLPVNFILVFMIAMSTDAGANTLSIYILEDLLSLIWMCFIPFIFLIMFPHSISILTMLTSRKKKDYNLKLYLVLVLLASLPHSYMLVSCHANTSYEYKQEVIKLNQEIEKLNQETEEFNN